MFACTLVKCVPSHLHYKVLFSCNVLVKLYHTWIAYLFHYSFCLLAWPINTIIMFVRVRGWWQCYCVPRVTFCVGGIQCTVAKSHWFMLRRSVDHARCIPWSMHQVSTAYTLTARYSLHWHRCGRHDKDTWYLSPPEGDLYDTLCVSQAGFNRDRCI